MSAKRVLDRPIQFRAGELSDDLLERAEEGRPPSWVAQRDLERYYQLLKLSLPTFGEGEASLIVDALNGSLIFPYSAQVVWAEVADAIQMDGLDEKWKVDGKALVERLRALTAFEQLAIADAAERFWSGPYRSADLAQSLREVGLVRDKDERRLP
jgi:hypothetical protein